MSDPPDGTQKRVFLLHRHGLPLWSPIRAIREFGDKEPLAAIFEAAADLQSDEQLFIRFAVEPASPAQMLRASNQLLGRASLTSFDGLMTAILGSNSRLPRVETKVQKLLVQRLDHARLFAVRGVVVLSGQSQHRLHSCSQSLRAVFTSHFDAGFGSFVFGLSEEHARLDRQQMTMLLSDSELASLWHPVSDVSLPGVSHVRLPSRPLPPGLSGASGMLVGYHHHRGTQRPVRLAFWDAAQGPIAILGKTGYGKSVLTHHLLAAQIARTDKVGLALLDPNGTLALDIASRSIPESRRGDVLLVEFGESAHPVSLPLLTPPKGLAPEHLDSFVETTVTILRSIFEASWSSTRLEDAVYALVATLCRLPDATLLDTAGLFHQPSFRRRALANLTDVAALEFWAEYEQLSPSGQRELTAPIFRRLRSLYRTPTLRNILCQTQGLDIGASMGSGAILLHSLAGSTIASGANLLGELLIARLQLTAQGRLDTPLVQHRPFVLAVDESQRYSGASLPILLREARKANITTILATQYLDAWGETLVQSVLGNMGTLITFATGPSDARKLAALLRPFTAEQLENLNRYEVLAKLHLDGVSLPALPLQTLPVQSPSDAEVLATIRERTRALYTRPRTQVEEEIARRYARPSPGAQGSREDISSTRVWGEDFDEE